MAHYEYEFEVLALSAGGYSLFGGGKRVRAILVQAACEMLGGDPEHKCCLLLDFTDHPRAIADPWYTGNFEETFADISCGCEALLTHLLATRPELAAQS